MLVQKSPRKSSFNLFVTHLSIADFLMGVYLTIIGVADQVFHGIYLWEDVRWRSSTVCKTAGFLSLLSSEVSAFIICLITLDRFFVLRFPLSGLHFRLRSGQVAVFLLWLLGVVLATIPLLPATSNWQLYSKNAICIPLPVTSSSQAGHHYSFGVMVVMNFALFLFIALGQLSIYCSVRGNTMAPTDLTQHRPKDVTIARRLLTVAVSDFLCWFPVGLLGILTAQGVPVSGEVNVAMAIFVLPFNSALNPFLYTLNVIRERRDKAREQRLRVYLLSQTRDAHVINRK